MGELSLVLIILLVEALLWLAGLAYIYHARLRRRAAGRATAVEGTPALLASALHATRAALQSRGVLSGTDPEEVGALRLRAQVLELEQKLADPARRGDDYWANVCASYRALTELSSGGPAAGARAEPAVPPDTDCKEETRELNRLLDTQQETLDRLSAALAGLIEEPEAQWCQEAEIQSLREGTRRLRQGLDILSDESRYLAQRLDQLEAVGEPPHRAAGSV